MNTPIAQAVKTSIAMMEDLKLKLKCLYGQLHFYNECPYLNEDRRTIGWVMDKELQGRIKAEIMKNPWLKRQVDFNIKRARLRAQKQAFEQQREPQQGLITSYMAFALMSAFSIDKDSYELKNTWILDLGVNAHVCNNHTRFKFERMMKEDEKLMAGKMIYQIEAFGSVNITIQCPTGPKTLTLLNVVLAPGFFTNTTSLHHFMRKGVHWDTQGSHLHTNGRTFYSVQRVGSH
jgi:hypothetical protein